MSNSIVCPYLQVLYAVFRMCPSQADTKAVHSQLWCSVSSEPCLPAVIKEHSAAPVFTISHTHQTEYHNTCTDKRTNGTTEKGCLPSALSPLT